MNQQAMNRNPWPGLSSYKEPKAGETPLAFCGRNHEIEDLVPLIKGHIFTTLYGSSGLGKTSLLNAGVFPKLKMEGNFLPINIRLGLTPENVSLQQSIVSAITEKIQEINGRIIEQDAIKQHFELGMPQADSSDYLWTYFAINQFLNPDNQPLTIILAFDQFEEVLYSRSDDATCLLKQILFVMNNDNHLPSFEHDGVVYEYATNYRFIAILREDDLFMLEDIIDNNYLQSMKNNRYRLRELKESAARDVIQIPGKDCIKEDEIEDVTSQIIQYSKDNDGTISSSMISFLCNRLFTKGNGLITSKLVKENEGKTLQEFCQELLAKLPYDEFTKFTELLVEDGRRKLISYDAFKKNIPHGDYLFNEESRLLDFVNIRKKQKHVEIIHDKFAAIIPAIKQELDAAREKERLEAEKEKAEQIAQVAQNQAEEAKNQVAEATVEKKQLEKEKRIAVKLAEEAQNQVVEAKSQAAEAAEAVEVANSRIKRRNMWLSISTLATIISAGLIAFFALKPDKTIIPIDDPMNIELVFSGDKTLMGYDWKAKVCFIGIDTLEMKYGVTGKPVNPNDTIEIKAKGDKNQNPDTIKLTIPKRKLKADFKVQVIPVNLCEEQTQDISIEPDTNSNIDTKTITLTRSEKAMFKLEGTVTSTNGKPLLDALVIVGDEARQTDKNGSFTFYLNDLTELRDKAFYALKNEYDHKEINVEHIIELLQNNQKITIPLSLKSNYRGLYRRILQLTKDTLVGYYNRHGTTKGIDSVLTASDSTLLKTYLGPGFKVSKPTKCHSEKNDTTYYFFFNTKTKSVLGYYETKETIKPFKGTIFKIEPEEDDNKNEKPSYDQWQLTLSAFDEVYNRERISGILSGNKLIRN